MDRAHFTHPHPNLFLETHHWHGKNTQIMTNNFLKRNIYLHSAY